MQSATNCEPYAVLESTILSWREKQVRCRARTVHFGLWLTPLELALNEKQIPQVIGNNRRASRKWNARKELSSLQSRCSPS